MKLFIIIIILVAVWLYLVFPRKKNKSKQETNSYSNKGIRSHDHLTKKELLEKTNENHKNNIDYVTPFFLDPPKSSGKWYCLSEYGEKIYLVNLDEYKCSCGIFAKIKSEFPVDHFGRYCKHLYSLSRHLGYCRNANIKHELISAYLDEKEQSNRSLGDFYYLKTINENDVLIVQAVGTGWVDVLTRKFRSRDTNKCSGDIMRYGYCKGNNRWAYGDAPYKPMDIKESIRTLPADVEIEQKFNSGINFSIEGFLRLAEKHVSIDSSLLSAVYELLNDTSDIDIITNTLLKLQKMKNIDGKQLALYYLKHGENLYKQQSQAYDLFFQEAISLNPECQSKVEAIVSCDTKASQLLPAKSLYKSIRQVEEEESLILQDQERELRAKLTIVDKKIIPLEIEKRSFDLADKSKAKDEALKVLSKSLSSDKYDYIGYEYSYLTDSLVDARGVERRSENVNDVINYMATKAILNGEVSSRIVARMYKIKGQVAVKRSDIKTAITYFEQAIEYDEKVGVKRLLSGLRKKQKDDS